MNESSGSKLDYQLIAEKVANSTEFLPAVLAFIGELSKIKPQEVAEVLGQECRQYLDERSSSDCQARESIPENNNLIKPVSLRLKKHFTVCKKEHSNTYTVTLKPFVRQYILDRLRQAQGQNMSDIELCKILAEAKETSLNKDKHLESRDIRRRQQNYIKCLINGQPLRTSITTLLRLLDNELLTDIIDCSFVSVEYYNTYTNTTRI